MKRFFTLLLVAVLATSNAFAGAMFFGRNRTTTATRALVQTQPQGAITATNFTTQPTVYAVDAAGNIDRDFVGPVTLAKAYGSGTLSGTATVLATGGAATFSGLKVTGAGHHVLEATVSGLTAARSGNITVMPAATTAPTVLTYGANTTDKTDCGTLAAIDDLPTGAFTAIFKIYRTATGNNQFIASKHNGAGWYIQIDDQISAGEIAASVDRASGDAFALSNSSNVVPLNSWYWVAVTFDPADGTRTLRLYRAASGAALAEVSGYEGSTANGSGSVVSDAAANLWIGNIQATNANPFKGLIGAGAVFNKVLTQQEMINCTIGIDRQSAAQVNGIGGCKLFHLLNSAGTLTDLSTNSNSGTTTGATTATGELVFAPSVFAVSLDAVDGTDYWYTSPHAQVSYTTTATSLDLSAVRTLDAAYDRQAAIAVFENGVYKDQFLVPAIGRAYGTISLTAGSKTVTIENGVRSNPSSGGNQGTFVTSVKFNASATEVVPTTYAPNRTIAWITDSLSDGFVTYPVGQYGLLDQFRSYARGLGYEVFHEGGGGWQVYDFAADGTARTASTAMVATISPEILMLELGTNDIFRSDWTSSSFGTGYAAWLVALNAELPRLGIKAVTQPKNGGSESGYSTWRTEITNAASGKAYVAVTNGNPDFWDGSDVNTDASPDGTHPGNTATTTYILPRAKTINGL